MKKVVFIDWNKTLSHDLFWGQLKNPSHIHHTYHASIDRWLFKENSVLIEPWMLGKLSYQEVAYKMSQSTNISIDIITKELRFSCEKMRFCINGIENIIRDIQKKGVKVVIATDNMDTFTKFTVPALRLDALFDNILNSYEIRRLKDDVDPISGILFFDTFLKEDKPVLIAIRDIEPDAANPLSATEVKLLWEKVYAANPLVKVIIIPDIESVNYGRGVGYAINEINVPDTVAAISATEIRRQVIAGETDWKKFVDTNIHEMLTGYLQSK